MSSQPFYHLRPNKYIDRHLFVQVLQQLKLELDIVNYSYVGFGSFLFEDFKLIHNQLDICTMYSLENDSTIYERALFNKPYECVNILNTSSQNFINSSSFDDPLIVWLDFTSPRNLSMQLSDFCGFLSLMGRHDILRITLNANPKTLGEKNDDDSDEDIKDKRFKKLSDRIGRFLPTDVKSDDITLTNYPLLLLRCLEKAAQDTLKQTEIKKKYFCPIFSTIYNDGPHQMVTLTGIILDDNEDETNVKSCLNKSDFVSFRWNEPILIKVPSLTTKEMLHINQLFPDSGTTKQQIVDNFFHFFDNDDEKVQSYLQFYKQYPNFHHVSL
ncbi:hypothetical protein MmiEs2_10500 [Methanimicrococcus stummii]|uniref:Uncharacterized protein n=1 Tax=Methanimicrococcus stummii TaxID=3028294 RepID=A0AA96V8S7_9EURY|nr:O-methyltransferase [Methanimicrococcus sp. Es2]WNY28842.1 hypothetical protein MmiEs2_10500 [Methanimicrococcus sp. Es2]